MAEPNNLAEKQLNDEEKNNIKVPISSWFHFLSKKSSEHSRFVFTYKIEINRTKLFYLSKINTNSNQPKL